MTSTRCGFPPPIPPLQGVVTGQLGGARSLLRNILTTTTFNLVSRQGGPGVGVVRVNGDSAAVSTITI